MRKLLLVLSVLLGALALPLPSRAQILKQQFAPDCEFAFDFTAAGRQPAAISNALGVAGFDNRQTACTTWHMEYYVEGFSAVSVEIDEAPSAAGIPGAWVTWPNVASGALPLTATTSGVITAYKYFPFVSVNLNSVTGTGAVHGRAIGYRPFTTGDVNASPGSSTPNPLNVVGNLANGAAVAGNPVLVSGSDGVNIRTLKTDTGGYLDMALNSAASGGVDGVSNANINYWGGASGSGAPAAIVPLYFNGTSWDRGITCPNTSTFSVASTVTQVIPLSGSARVRVCSFTINPSTVTAGSTDIVYGTGANCGTGTTTLTGAYTLPASAVVDIAPPALGALSPLTTPTGQAVCVRAVTSTVNGFIVWEQH